MIFSLRSTLTLVVAARCSGLASEHGGVAAGRAAAVATSPSGGIPRRLMLAAAAVATIPIPAFAAPVATSPDGTAVTLKLADGSTQTFPAQPLPPDFAKGLKLPITDITDKVFGFADYPPEYPLTAKDMKRLDESDDSSFYGGDDGACRALRIQPPAHPSPAHNLPLRRPLTDHPAT